ncbi:MAG: SGNH/GDSL hydrolase family protein [Rhodanobacteraceae bacterium]|nr:SGNH/GDSL hydrolase family protein [Rhodanobacteraceae bacterium]
MWPELLLAGVFAGHAAEARPLRYLALGDSYTIGEGVAADQCWPQQLVMRLRAEGIALADAQIIATTGWTTDELYAAMDTAALAPPYDFVSLSIGVNNQYRGRGGLNYRQEFAALLQRAIRLTDQRPERVIVVSIPDWGVTRFGRESGRDTALIARELDAFNVINREEAQRHQVTWADVSAISRHAGADPSQLAADGLHPSGLQYRNWLESILPAARQALSTR